MDALTIRGIITVLNTPFTLQNELDASSLRRNVRAGVAAGVAGFLVPGLAAEVHNLTKEERLRMVQIVLDETGGDIPVIGGASASAGDRAAYSRTLTELGCAGIMVQIPYVNDEQFEQEVREVADTNPGFLMLQDWDTSGFGAPVALISRLFRDIKVFQSYKIEVVPAGLKYSQILEATEGKLHVAGGWAVTQLIEALDRGVHAFMPTGLHELYVAIYKMYMSGQRDEARNLFHELLPVLVFSNQHLDFSIRFFKRLLYRQGVYSTPHVREPILPFDEIHSRIADELIADAMKLTARISQ